MNAESIKTWTIRALVIALLVLIGFWVANNTYWDDISVPTPLRGEAATNPQYAAREFLKALDVRVEEHKALNTLPPVDGVLVLGFWHWDLVAARRERLEAWVRAGGRLIVDDSVIGLSGSFAEFSGINAQYPSYDEDEDGDEEDADVENEDESNDPDRSAIPAAFNAEERCQDWDLSSNANAGGRSHFLVCRVATIGWLESKGKADWAVANKDGAQALRMRVGRGYVTVINAMPFENRALPNADNGALLVAVTQLKRGDQVWLVTEKEHPSVLTLIWLYGAPVVVLFCLFVAAALWRSAARFGPKIAAPTIARRSLAEQIRGTGWFVLRLGGARHLHAAMLRALKEAAGRRIVRYAGLSTERQLDVLHEHTGIERDELQQAMYGAALLTGRQSRHQLYKAIATLETARRILASETSAHSTDNSKSTLKEQEASHAN